MLVVVAVAGCRARAPAGQSAIAAPANTISAPTQIQVTSGETISRNVAGGGELVYERLSPSSACARNAPRSASDSSVASANTLSPSSIRGSSRPMSGATAVQRSRRTPARSATSVVASPSKKRDTAPRLGSVLGK